MRERDWAIRDESDVGVSTALFSVNIFTLN